MSTQAQPSSIATTFIDGLAVLDAPGPGAPVVLVPGFTGSKEDYGLIVSELGRRAIAIDLPGQYESPGPENIDAYSTRALAQRLVRFLRELDGPVHLVGHSFGGLVGRAAIVEAPELVSSLVLLCSGPSGLPLPRRQESELLIAGAAGITMSQLWDAVAAYRTSRGIATGEFNATRWKSSSSAGLIGMGRAVLDEPDEIGHLAALRIPTLVVTGENDNAWSPEVQAEMAQRLGCDQIVIADAAHSPAIEAPTATAAVLVEWLAGQD